ncbi:MAG: heavy metal-responsive transcriptional regulator [Gemmatimonadetes bacterium]|nr:MAG: heavy metal-responsive transcriptional regulator [Gemmatimonadota bacterium]
MRIGELAARAGVSPDAIRYYEREGVLPPPRRSSSGYRQYDSGAVERVRFIRKAKALGLRLSEVREVFEIASGGRAPCTHVRTLLEGHLRDVEARMRELRSLRTTLRRTLEQLDQAPPSAGRTCAVIEALPEDRERGRGAPRPQTGGDETLRSRGGRDSGQGRDG